MKVEQFVEKKVQVFLRRVNRNFYFISVKREQNSQCIFVNVLLKSTQILCFNVAKTVSVNIDLNKIWLKFFCNLAVSLHLSSDFKITNVFTPLLYLIDLVIYWNDWNLQIKSSSHISIKFFHLYNLSFLFSLYSS